VGSVIELADKIMSGEIVVSNSDKEIHAHTHINLFIPNIIQRQIIVY
jgi:hypothetical protein